MRGFAQTSLISFHHRRWLVPDYRSSGCHHCSTSSAASIFEKFLRFCLLTPGVPFCFSLRTLQIQKLLMISLKCLPMALLINTKVRIRHYPATCLDAHSWSLSRPSMWPICSSFENISDLCMCNLPILGRSDLPKLSERQERKLKQLTIVSLASKSRVCGNDLLLPVLSNTHVNYVNFPHTCLIRN